MASTATLVGVIAVVAIAILVLRALLWWFVRAPAQRAGGRLASDRPSRISISTSYAMSAAIALLVGLVALVVSHHGTVSLDQAADDAFRPYRSAWMLKAAEWVTAIGAGPSLAAILGTATALLLAGPRTGAIAPLWTTFLGAQATTWTAKYIIARPRPVFLPGITEWNPSFPSGHATATTALVGMLGLIVASGMPGLRVRFETGFWTAAIIALICFSRIFLGVHFVTDVLAGILVGIIWLLIGYHVGARRGWRRPGGSGWG